MNSGNVFMIGSRLLFSVFVDNHEAQRAIGGEDLALTFYEAYLYKQAVIFTMAWPYGTTRIMSSYRWPGGRLTYDR